MKKEYVMVIGDVDTFIEKCKKQPSEMVKLITLEDEIKRRTNGVCSTIEQFIKVRSGIMLLYGGTYESDEKILEKINKAPAELLVNDIEELCEDPAFDPLMIYSVGDEFKLIAYNEGFNEIISEAKDIGFPERYYVAAGPLLANNKTISILSKGTLGMLDTSVLRLSWDAGKLIYNRTPDGDRSQDPKHITWLDVQIFNTDGKSSTWKPSDKFTLFRKKGFDAEVVEA